MAEGVELTFLGKKIGNRSYNTGTINRMRIFWHSLKWDEKGNEWEESKWWTIILSEIWRRSTSCVWNLAEICLHENISSSLANDGSSEQTYRRRFPLDHLFFLGLKLDRLQCELGKSTETDTDLVKNGNQKCAQKCWDTVQLSLCWGQKRRSEPVPWELWENQENEV